MLLATALALLITGCAQQTFTVQNKPAAVAPKETITHHFFVSGIGQKKTVDAAKICGGAENVVKTETQQTFVNGLLGFITLGIYTPLEVCVCIAHNNCMSCPSIWATLSTLLINILLGSFQLFLHSDQPLSEGEIIPFSGVCQSGEAALSTPEAVVASRTLTDRLL
ncbi:lipoprotein bor [Caerostris extrusa]|uniref:Lipoprotein bor n=4 Tax=cellular organisms TaxID=131567 RepID=A0AAV4QW86_CAEEX|nr:lipoprotein bor [Caerostris extrusa]